MDLQFLEQKFAQMGSRVKVESFTDRELRTTSVPATNPLTLDVRTDKKGEFFLLRTREASLDSLEVVDLRVELRHLLLLNRNEERKDKFLCGHDERHWFAAAVPGKQVSNVVTAMEALKPVMVHAQQSSKGLKLAERLSRKNRAFIRQGEWFFVPVPGLKVDPRLVLKNEPLSRGRGSKPHLCQYVYRVGGETVYVCSQHPTGLTSQEYEQIVHEVPAARNWKWQVMKRDSQAYARGAVSHLDHATIYLDGWHRILMNTEGAAPAARNVVFLD